MTFISICYIKKASLNGIEFKKCDKAYFLLKVKKNNYQFFIQ